MDQHHTENHHSKGLLALTLGALGVVYGDIGTSPLYSVSEIFSEHAGVHRTPEMIIGGISLLVWVLSIIIGIKYIRFVLSAHNDGEGGVFALYSNLITKVKKSKFVLIMSAILIFGAGLLYGDGIITPAISVISAAEGLGVLSPVFKPYIVPLTVAILTVLFFIQKNGTHKVGKIFGPVIILWFFTIAGLGLRQIIMNPQILLAINPLNAVFFLTHVPLAKLLIVMGSVMLVVTGGEAMFADMGHFGAKPIKLGWTFLVYPALLLNYFGQGGSLLSVAGNSAENVFYSMVPANIMLPVIIIATLATIIASQALISGAFSLTAQAVSLGLLPRIKIIHTNSEHEGQIYIPAVNWAVYAGCIALVVFFGSSSKLASAYGLAVSAVELMTTISVAIIAINIWKWNKFKAVGIFMIFGLIEIFFLTSNSLKFLSGGWIPLTVAVVIYAIMKIWMWGNNGIKNQMDKLRMTTINDLIKVKKEKSVGFPQPSIFMTPYFIQTVDEKVPAILEVFYKRYGMIPKDMILLNVNIEKVPYTEDSKYEISNLYTDKNHGSITSVRINFGFMEDHDVEGIIKHLAKRKEIPLPDDNKEWLIHVSSARLFKYKMAALRKIVFGIFAAFYKNSQRTDEYYGLGKKYDLTVEAVPVKI